MGPASRQMHVIAQTLRTNALWGSLLGTAAYAGVRFEPPVALRKKGRDDVLRV